MSNVPLSPFAVCAFSGDGCLLAGAALRSHFLDIKEWSDAKTIIDTDPGQDDAVAILLALASQEFDILGITTVAGNVPLDLTTINARKICDLAGRRDCRVFAGQDKPLARPLVDG